MVEVLCINGDKFIPLGNIKYWNISRNSTGDIIYVYMINGDELTFEIGTNYTIEVNNI